MNRNVIKPFKWCEPSTEIDDAESYRQQVAKEQERADLRGTEAKIGDPQFSLHLQANQGIDERHQKGDQAQARHAEVRTGRSSQRNENDDLRKHIAGVVDKEAVLRPFNVPQPSERSVQGITKPVSQKTDT